jgi:hypothetical protein
LAAHFNFRVGIKLFKTRDQCFNVHRQAVIAHSEFIGHPPVTILSMTNYISSIYMTKRYFTVSTYEYQEGWMM